MTWSHAIPQAEPEGTGLGKGRFQGAGRGWH
jgi:hypothetical protein